MSSNDRFGSSKEIEIYEHPRKSVRCNFSIAAENLSSQYPVAQIVFGVIMELNLS